MYPSFHVGFGLLFAIALYILFPGMGLIGVSLVFIFSFIGDFDHYMVHVIKNKNFSLRKAYKFFINMAEDINRKKITKTPLFIFHTVEFIAFLVVLSFAWNPLFYAALGLLFHLFLDFVETSHSKNPEIKCFSIILCKLRKE